MKFGVQKLDWGNFYVIYRVTSKDLIKKYNIDLIKRCSSLLTFFFNKLMAEAGPQEGLKIRGKGST